MALTKEAKRLIPDRGFAKTYHDSQELRNSRDLCHFSAQL